MGYTSNERLPYLLASLSFCLDSPRLLLKVAAVVCSFIKCLKGGFPIRYPYRAHGCPRYSHGLMDSPHSHGDRDQTEFSPPKYQCISTWRWISLGDMLLLEALTRPFLHSESPSRLSETCSERSGGSSLVVCTQLVLVCELCPLILPGCRSRFYNPDEALPEASNGSLAQCLVREIEARTVPKYLPYFRGAHGFLSSSPHPYRGRLLYTGTNPK